MEKDKYKKNVILSGILTLTMLASACAQSSNDVTVKIKEKTEGPDLEPTIEMEEEVTWAQFDESVCMYRVDFDRFLADKLKLSQLALENSDVIEVIELVREELGEEFYLKDKHSKTLYNLDGKSVNISSGNGGRWINVVFYRGEEALKYEVQVEKNGNTSNISRAREEGFLKFSKYFVINNEGKECIRTICLRENEEKYLSIGIHAGELFAWDNISFHTSLGEATVKLSKEDYDVLHEIMLSYSESDNLYAFLSDNIDLLNGYLDMIKEENTEYYEDLCGLINEYLEKAKILSFE